ncbi:hypothetical protein HKCCE3408_09600 [Rhodobacterales bacterium HKCCE3408]|nr:hypothetical protein [Rhodobacterales bacterium HKCCE3408]
MHHYRFPEMPDPHARYDASGRPFDPAEPYRAAFAKARYEYRRQRRKELFLRGPRFVTDAVKSLLPRTRRSDSLSGTTTTALPDRCG